MAQTRSKVLGNILEWYDMIKDPKLSYQNISNIFLDKKCVKIFFQLFVFHNHCYVWFSIICAESMQFVTSLMLSV